MVAYDVDSVDDDDSSRGYNTVSERYMGNNHGDHDHDNDHSFRTMSRLMLLDSSSARSDTVVTNTSMKSKKRAEHRHSGSAAGSMQEQVQQQQQQQQQQQRDMYETGQWGVISRRDKICFMMTLVLLVVGIAMAFVYAAAVVGGGNSSSSNSPMDASTKTPTGGGGSNGMNTGSGGSSNAPVLSGTSIGVNRNKNDHNDTIYYTDTEQYDALRDAIVTLAPESIASQILLHIPENINEFEPKFDDDTNMDDVYQRAMSWFLYNDTVTIKYESELVSRFVLVVTYFNNGGASKLWTNSENWMTSYHVCLWNGVRCNNHSNKNHQSDIDIIEVDMSNNGFVGSIHLAWSLLYKCKSILLNSNQMTGTIPGIVFGNILSLEYLYLQNNLLDGTIPSTLKSITSIHTMTSSLSTLFVQGNPNLTGSWPIEFCPSSSTFNNNSNNNATTTNVIRPIYSYGMDCSAIQCSCCDPALHCFN
jgi:hypothetical protein